MSTTTEPRSTATHRETGFGRVFGAIWVSLLACVLLVVLSARGPDLWAIPLTLVLAGCLAVIMRELSHLLDEGAGREADVLPVAAAPIVAVPRAVGPRSADAAPAHQPVAHV